MIANLSSFTSQFDAPLLENGKSLFDNNGVLSLTNKDLNWNAQVNDNKNYKVTIRVEKNKATDVFCSCGPKICPHIIAVMYSLQSRLDIKPEKFKPEDLAPDPVKIFGNKMNNLIWTSRADNSKDGELEKLGVHISLKDTNINKLKVTVRNDLSGRQTNPIFTGAHKLMGAAIREYGKKNYTAVFDVARAVLEQLSAMKAIENSAIETSRAAAFMFQELYNNADVPISLKTEIFNWVTRTWNDVAYDYYQDSLVDSVTSNPNENVLDKKAVELLKMVRRSIVTKDAVTNALKRLLKHNSESASRDFMYNNLPRFRLSLIQEAFDRNDLAEAKKLAHEGIADGENNAKSYWEFLYKIAELENDIPAKRRYYLFAFIESAFSESFYEKCRSTYTTEEWKLAYPKWIEAIGKPDNLRKQIKIAKFYIREENADQLAKFLQTYPTYELAVETQVFLEQAHSKVVKEVFYNFFMNYTRNAQHNAEVGLRIRSLLGSACKTTWSKKMIKQLRSELLELHPTWNAFNAALGKPL